MKPGAEELRWLHGHFVSRTEGLTMPSRAELLMWTMRVYVFALYFFALCAQVLCEIDAVVHHHLLSQSQHSPHV